NEILEVKNVYSAYKQLDTYNPYSVADLKRAHKIMTKGLIKESGVFRKGEEGVFQDGVCIFVAPPARIVNTHIKNLFIWMEENNTAIHPLILSSVFHYEFVFIHPFSDGNGRMARLWQTLILGKWNSIFMYMPIESQIEKHQNNYYDAISKSHINGTSNDFIEFSLNMIEKSIDSFTLQFESTNSYGDYVNRLLKAMKLGKAYSTNEILDLLGLKSKDNLRKNYINPALDEGLIEMTLPDKPTSKNQKYFRSSNLL
ncbi:MAG: Fic family protein, partial [Coriobacteriales bacterium]|nr:Fic family protein [Coriobacteriales bacterium]